MTDDAATRHRLAGLVPPDQAQEVCGCRAIGEQEAGPGLLVSGIVGNGVAIGESVRAELSVLAEAQGEREALAPRTLRCRSDGRPATDVALIEQDGVVVGGDAAVADGSLTGLVLVPWTSCTRCGQVLMRAHTREAWGDLSYLVEHYAITMPDRVTVTRLFPGDSVDAALTGLRESCR